MYIIYIYMNLFKTNTFDSRSNYIPTLNFLSVFYSKKKFSIVQVHIQLVMQDK